MTAWLLGTAAAVVGCFFLAMVALFWGLGVLMDWAERPKGFDVHAQEAINTAAPDEIELDEHGRRFIRFQLAFLDADPNKQLDRRQAFRRDAVELDTKQSAEWRRLVNEDFEGINQ